MQNQKLPPHDIDAEEAVIGSLLIDGQAVYKISTFLKQQDFYSERNSLIFGSCLSLYEHDEAINQITVAQELDRQGKLETCGGAAYLSHLISICPTSLDIEHYAQIVYRLSVMRNLIRAADQISSIGFEADPDLDSSFSRAEDVLFRVRHGQSPRDFVHIRQVLDQYFEAADTAGHTQGKPSFVLSGFTGLDEFLGGLQPSDLIIVAGRPSLGKSSLALNITRNATLNQNSRVAFFSLEMSRESLMLRLLSSESGINLRRVRLGQHLSDDEERRIMEATGTLSEASLYIDDTPQLRVVEMRSKARRLHYEHGINLIIVDYLQLMQGETKTENRVQEISLVSRSLKALARELNVPVIAVSQLSRAVEWRASHEPQLSDLRESGSIEQDADVVLFIYRDDYYYKTREEWEKDHPDREYPEGIADIIIAKHRNGPIGRIKLRFRHSMAKFENLTSEEPSLL